MAINPEAVGLEGQGPDRKWRSKDGLLYALGVGCGIDDLQFCTEKDQQVLPTFAVIIGGGGAPMGQVGTFNPAMLVHGEQAVFLEKPIPVEGELSSKGRIAAIWDKGNGAVITTESEATDKATGELLFKTRSSVFIRGAGGFGGERGPKTEKFEEPSREADHAVEYQTAEDQALIYRLSGDRNPLHSDPEFAKMAGFDKPILHGLCTYGFTGRALLSALCGNDPSRFKSIEGRFSKPVFPGDQLTVKMWVDGNEAQFRTYTQRGEVVIDHGRFTFAS